jgi:FixJ family two-component response regulator
MHGPSDTPCVYVIDPDEAACKAVAELVSTLNLPCQVFGSGRDFFAAYGGSSPGCLVLEVRVPDMSGLQIERRMAANHLPMPLIFLSDQADVSVAVELMRRGSVHYLQKPHRPLELLTAIQEALAVDSRRRRAWQRAERIAKRVALLTPKEQEVLRMLAQAQPSHAIAEHLGVTRRAVEIRRANMARKLRLKSPIALVRFAMLARQRASQQSWSRAQPSRRYAAS